MIRKYAEIFCWKNVSSFCSAKATHIFSAKNIRILYIESTKTVNEMTLNELVKLTMLWTTGPRSLGINEFISFTCIMSPTSKKLEGHIAFGSFVRSSEIGSWNFIYRNRMETCVSSIGCIVPPYTTCVLFIELVFSDLCPFYDSCIIIWTYWNPVSKYLKNFLI